ncbi:MAG TPA: electron transport complex subunit RsxC [Tenuifilaceae bacterium]|nr:electron transport complex subunit RsxC [Bacteroidales bacterium]HOA08870.1 electron transport complex subunit RsxC [Tenuifilaceae bacterium]NLI87019.1 electron transport complex subunit RsxC [Bacteroidales bacterium]HOG71448.1 electron transport complex subunit RsxC [Tenuifilaceae bacterium]HOW21963.1 electron transport complex subunit RsxC [Tenuifilaceae bacterium]
MLKTFKKGGVHPPENKISAAQPVEVLPLPAKVIIPLSQHIGAPAEAMVAKGDRVKTGQLIAKSAGFVSANIHSTVSGIVESLEPVMDSSGYKRPAITINVEGDDWEPSVDRSPNLKKEITLSAQDIIKKIAEAGIVGLGGATFPTHVKLSVPAGKKAEMLVINGVECEPFLTSDHRLMLEKGHELMIGIQILMKALNVPKAMVGIEANKPDAVSHLQSLAKSYSGIEVQPLKVKYPQGGEKQLIKALTGREVPSGGLPIDIGAVVHNVGTALAVYEAVQKNKPLVERIVTVTGKNLAHPSNFLVRIGTPVSALIAAAGGLPDDTGKVVSGGPMMGKAVSSIDVPVTKGTSGILVIPAAESKRKPEGVCIRCAKCVSVCPMGLEPYLLYRLGQRMQYSQMEVERVLDCMECGSCSFECPANLFLLDFIRLGKVEVGKIVRERKN